MKAAPQPGHRRTQQAEAADPLGRRAVRPRWRSGRPSSCPPGGRGRSPASPSARGCSRRTSRRCSRRGRACPRSRSPGGPARGPCSGWLSAAAVSNSEARVPPRPWSSSTSGPLPMVRVEIRWRPDRDVADLQQRRTAAAQAEHPLEGDGVVEVAPDVQPPAAERVDAGELALAQRQPGRGVGGDRDVRAAAGRRPCAPGRRARCSGPPRCGRDRTGGCGRWRRSRGSSRGSAPAASERHRRRRPAVADGSVVRHRRRHPTDRPGRTIHRRLELPHLAHDPTARHPHRRGAGARAAGARDGSASTPAARRSTGGSTSATPGRTWCSACSSAFSPTRATR